MGVTYPINSLFNAIITILSNTTRWNAYVSSFFLFSLNITPSHKFDLFTLVIKRQKGNKTKKKKKNENKKRNTKFNISLQKCLDSYQERKSYTFTHRIGIIRDNS